MPTPIDRELAKYVEDLRAGRVKAADALMRALDQSLFRLARAVTGDDAEAEDVVQEAYMRAFTSLGRLKSPTAFRSWIARIVYNEALRRTLQRKRHVSLEVAGSMLEGVGATAGWTTARMPSQPDEEVHHRQVNRLLERAIDRLPVNFRVAFVLREVEGLSVQETALQLDLKPETVRTRHYRARALLRQDLTNLFRESLSDVFAFAGERCDRLRASIMVRLTGRAPTEARSVPFPRVSARQI
jgi:RNA polymerase sigma-70 factor, ECF subfamily